MMVIEREQFSKEELSDKLKPALVNVIENPQNDPLLGSFLAAYQYRSERFWLGESGNIPSRPNGLAYALEQALQRYIPPQDSTEEKEIDKDFMGAEMPEESRALLLAQIPEILDGKFTVFDFARGLQRRNVKIVDLSNEQLEEHLTMALRKYVLDGKRGTATSDPW